MQPGIWTSYLYPSTPEEMVEQFAAKGWFHLELSTEHGDALLQRGDPEKTGRNFARFAGDRGVSLPQGHLWLTCDIAAADQDPVVDALKRWLDLFAAVGVRAAVLHPGGNELRRREASREEIRERQVRALRHLSEHLGDTNLTICLENVSGIPEAEDLLALIDAVGRSNLGICLDTGHLNLASGDQAGFIGTAGSSLKALHLADNEGQSDQHLMPYGRGTVDWDAVMWALRDLPYEGLLNLEIPGENRGPLPVLLAKLDYLERIVQFMLEEQSTSERILTRR